MEEVLKRAIAREEGSDNYGEEMMIDLELLHDLTFSLDNAKNLCVLGGINWLLDQVFQNSDKGVRLKCALILGECAQNQLYLQNHLMRFHPLRLMNVVLREEDNANKEAAFGALSSLIRGLNIDMKRKFIEVDGIEYLVHILVDAKYSTKLKTKVMNVIRDLIEHEKHLHTDVDYLGKESYENTKGKVVNNKETMHVEVKQDNKMDEVKEEQSVENLKFKGIVKEKLFLSDFHNLQL